MPESNVHVVMTGDEARLAAAQRRAAQSQDELTDSVFKSNRELNAFASNVDKLDMTPADRAREKMARLSEALARGKITQEQFDAASQRVNQRIGEKTRGVQSLTESVEQLGARFGPLGQSLATVATGFLSGQAAVDFFRAALQHGREEMDRAKASLDGMADARQKLSQVAVDSKDLQEMDDRADRLAMRYGMVGKSADDARKEIRQIVFDARSQQFEPVVEQIVRAAPVVETKQAGMVAGKLPKFFEGQIGSMEAISGTLVAAKQSELVFGDLAKGLLKVAEGGKIAGADFAETAGIMAVMTSKFANADTAADRMKALGTKLGMSDEFRGLGVVGGVKALQAMPEETRKGFLKDSMELNQAFAAMSEAMPAVEASIAKVRAEIDTMRRGGQSTLERQLQARFDPATELGRQESAALKAQREQIALAVAEQRKFSVEAKDREAAVTAERRKMLAEDRNLVSRTAAGIVGKTAESLQAPAPLAAQFAERAGRMGEGYREPLQVALSVAQAQGGPLGLFAKMAADIRNAVIDQRRAEQQAAVLPPVRGAAAAGAQMPAAAGVPTSELTGEQAAAIVLKRQADAQQREAAAKAAAEAKAERERTLADIRRAGADREAEFARRRTDIETARGAGDITAAEATRALSALEIEIRKFRESQERDAAKPRASDPAAVRQALRRGETIQEIAAERRQQAAPVTVPAPRPPAQRATEPAGGRLGVSVPFLPVRAGTVGPPAAAAARPINDALAATPREPGLVLPPGASVWPGVERVAVRETAAARFDAPAGLGGVRREDGPRVVREGWGAERNRRIGTDGGALVQDVARMDREVRGQPGTGRGHPGAGRQEAERPAHPAEFLLAGPRTGADMGGVEDLLRQNLRVQQDLLAAVRSGQRPGPRPLPAPNVGGSIRDAQLAELAVG